MQQVAVIGGTGVVGRHVVAALEQRGHRAVIAARSTGVDVITGNGLAEALAGCDAVVDTSNVTTMSKKESVAFFDAATRNLVEAARNAEVSHVVGLSIVGCDEVDFGYYFGKRRQEEILLSERVPASVLRATQFHEFPGQVLDRMGGPVAIIPDMLMQPVAAADVGVALAELALGDPVGRAPDLAGPEQHRITDLARRLLRARGSRRKVLKVRFPGQAGRAMATGKLVAAGPGSRGKQTWDEWLGEGQR